MAGLDPAIRQALMRADADSTGTPDYDVLAEAAIVAVMERMAVHALHGKPCRLPPLSTANRWQRSAG